MKKRLLAAIMSLCMIVSLMPVSAFAAPGEDMEDRSGGSQDAYFYILKPDEAQDAERVPENFIYMGGGQINGAPPAGDRYGDVIDKSDNEWNEWECVSPNIMPNVDYEGETYVYWDRSTSPSEPESSYYTVTWFRYASAYGANDAGVIGMCWHVDGFVTLSNKVNVQFQVKFPTENDFTVVGSNGEAGDEDNYWYVDRNSTLGDISDQPKMGERIKDGVTYEFDGWYTDKDCTEKADDTTAITQDPTIFYGQYKEKGPDITVTKELATVNGVDVVGDPEDTVLHVGDKVTWTVTVKNNTNEHIGNVSLTDSLKTSHPYQVTIEPSGEETAFGLDAAGTEGDTKTFTVTYLEIADSYANKTLENTVTVTYSGKKYTATATNTVEDVKPTVDPDTDIFFFIAQPTSQILSDNENDYRYLTHGGVINTEKAVEAGIDANGITDTNNETTITQYVQTWPESGTLGDTRDVGFKVASQPVGTGSIWTIDKDGNVTSFSLDIDGTTYTSDQYEIRWVKISHATTANREDPDINNSVRYHVDGMLYEKTTVENILSKINITKTVEDNLWPYNNNGVQMTGAEFDIYLDRANDTGNQFTDIKIGKVTPNNGQYDFIVEAGLTSKYLTPGEYVIKEVLTETQEYMWEAPETEYGFTLNSDGSVTVNGSVVAEGQKEAFAFTNTAKTFPLTYGS